MSLPQRPIGTSDGPHPPPFYPRHHAYQPRRPDYTSAASDSYHSEAVIHPDLRPTVSDRPVDASPPVPHSRAPINQQGTSAQSSSGAVKKRRKVNPPVTSTPPSDVVDDGKAAKIKTSMPAVLTREKKQKACANCRRAKLKCIVGDDQSDCVRCLARKEKCVFYPRNLDEDWQQTMTQDVYAAISHLSDVSSAVHHLIYHLSDQGIIPPFVTARGTLLDRYEAPQRELPATQGWDADRNKEMGAPGDRTRRMTRDEGYEEEKEATLSDGRSLLSAHKPAYQNQLHDSPQDDPQSSTHPGWYPDEVNLSRDRDYSSGPSLASYHPPQLSHPNRPILRMEMSHSAFDVPYRQDPQPTLISPTISVPQPNDHPIYASNGGFRPGPTSTISTVAYEGSLVPPDCLLGSDDPRDDVITEGMVGPRDAVKLVNHCHEHLSPFLFGYRLEFGFFPYLPEGPTYITPLILAVHCLLASERLPGLFHYHAPLADAALRLLLESPAGSWRTIDNVQEAVAEGSLILGEDALDPELGIGPEEIVAAAMLSLWMSERDAAPGFARMAFRYARGWIKLLSGPPRATIAEMTGIVTKERVASTTERARVWLLCYIADGIANSTEGLSSEPNRDPTVYCSELVPGTPADNTDKNDLVLAAHARLLHIFRSWQSGIDEKSSTESSTSASQDHQRLTAMVDLQTDEQLNIIRTWVPDHWVCVKQLEVYGLFVKTTMHSLLTRLTGLPSRQRAVYVARTVDEGMEMLEKCSTWSPARNVANLPQQYLTMIFVIAHIVVAEVVTTQQNARTGCAVTPAEACIVLTSLIDILGSAGQQDGHNIWIVVGSLKKLVAQLQSL